MRDAYKKIDLSKQDSVDAKVLAALEMPDEDKKQIAHLCNKVGVETISRAILTSLQILRHGNTPLTEEYWEKEDMDMRNYDRAQNYLRTKGIKPEEASDSDLWKAGINKEYAMKTRDEVRAEVEQAMTERRAGVRGEFDEVWDTLESVLTNDEFSWIQNFIGVGKAQDNKWEPTPKQSNRIDQLRHLGRALNSGLRDFFNMNPHLDTTLAATMEKAGTTEIQDKNARAKYDKLSSEFDDVSGNNQGDDKDPGKLSN